jgi:transcriptional regulator with XRE-family HTH domain
MKIRQDELGIGHNLRRLRNAAGLTQEQVVAQLDVRGLSIDRSVYAHMERDRYNIKVAELLALKEIFKVSTFDEFFCGLVLKTKNSD